jgi:hypothetical protein
MTVTIILFWLATTGALVYYEAAPRFHAGEPPPFTIPLTAEVSATSVQWNVLSDGKSIGTGTTQIERLADRTYELSARFKIERFDLFIIELHDLKITSKYCITQEGNLVNSSAFASFIAKNVPFSKGPVPVEFDFRGEVKEHQFQPKLIIRTSGKELKEFPELEPFPVSESGNILNPMHLVHKISGLSAGKTWRIPLMDPMRAVPSRLRISTPDVSVDELIASVSLDDLPHHGVDEPCYKIEYFKSGESRPLAATWVRRRDDAVLQQWARYEGLEYTLQRARGQ